MNCVCSVVRDDVSKITYTLSCSGQLWPGHALPRDQACDLYVYLSAFELLRVYSVTSQTHRDPGIL